MLGKLPGTELNFSEQAENDAFSIIEPLITATGGLTLSQLSGLTGLHGSTIQNWIKRGYVSAAFEKKYTEKQIIRILLINILRDTMKLEDIANLMTYLNGNVEDISDDIIHDKELYNLLCKLICFFEKNAIYSLLEISKGIEDFLGNEYNKNERDRLKRVLYIMTLGYRSSYLVRQIEAEFQLINNTRRKDYE